MRYGVLCLVIALMLLVFPISASLVSIDDAQAVIQLKTISSVTGVIDKTPVIGTGIPISDIQMVQIQLSKIGKVTETKTIQMYPDATVLVSSDFAGNANVMQISTRPGYPLMEVYYGYQKSILESWQYYFRRTTYDTIVANRKIPDWNTINGGGKEVLPDAETV